MLHRRQEHLEDTVFRGELARMEDDAQSWNDWYRSRGRRAFPTTEQELRNRETIAVYRVAGMVGSSRSYVPPRSPDVSPGVASEDSD